MSWLIRRVDTLPAVLTPSTIYFVDNGDGTATQYVTGQDGVARVTGGGGTYTGGAGISIVGSEIRMSIGTLPTAG